MSDDRLCYSPNPAQRYAHFLIGLPASGKSTFSAWLQQRTGGVIICPDQIRAQLYGAEVIQGDWQEIETEVFRQMTQAIATETTLIYDATNTRYEWRQDFLRRCPPVTWVAWYLTTPLPVCLMQNQRRSRQVPAAIMERMTADLEQHPPQQAEGFIDLIPLPDTSPETLRDLRKQHPQYLGD